MTCSEFPCYPFKAPSLSRRQPIADLQFERKTHSELASPYAEWRADEYRRTYYGGPVMPDEQCALAYQIDVLKHCRHKFSNSLEYGPGPTFHRAIAAAPYVTHMDMADWLPENLHELQAWLDRTPLSHDWRNFTHYILACEAHLPHESLVVKREELTRSIVRDLHLSDARNCNPLGPQRRAFYDLLISGFCLDAISDDQCVWRRCMRNVLSMLRAGGLLVIHALHRSSTYKVGTHAFPSANLSVDDLVGSLLENGFARSSIDVQVSPCLGNGVLGYTEIIVASGWKVKRCIPW